MWRAVNPVIGSLRLTGAETKGSASGYKFEVECPCGDRHFARWSDLKGMAADGLDHMCKSCATRARMKRAMATPEGKARQARMVAASKEGNVRCPEAVEAGRVKWATDEEARIAKLLAGARQRCENPRNSAYHNYGGRGVQFCFASAEEAARWVLDNLGFPPEGYSIDRIDNDRHYEPGNLRWASRTEQARNRRAYKNAVPNLKIAKALRPGLSDSQLRIMLKRGDSLETIKNWRKYDSAYAKRSPRV